MKNRLRAELWDKLHYVLGQSNDRMIRIELFYDGLIEIDFLEKALVYITESNPILHSSFYYHAINPYWKMEPYSSNDFLTVINTNDPVKEKERFLMQVIPVENKVQFKVAVINSSGKSLLCAIFNHMCMDGLGAHSFLKKLSKCYDHLSTGHPMPEIINGSRSFHKIYTGFSFWNRLFAMFLLKNVSLLKEKKSFAYSKEKPSDQEMIISMKLTHEEFRKIQVKGKHIGATVNDLLLSFYTQALYETCNFSVDKSLTITCMVDNRRYIKKSEKSGLTNHVGLMQCKIDRCGEGIEETIKHVRKLTSREKAGRFFGLKGIPLLRLGYSLPFFLVKRGTKAWFVSPVLGFSNLGNIDEDSLKLGNLNVTDGLYIGPVQYKPYLIVHAHKLCGNLNFVTAIRGDEEDRKRINSLFENIRENINEFIDDVKKDKH